MNICMLTSAHIPFDTRIFHKEAKSLSKFGHNVTIIAPRVESRVEQADGIKIITIPRYKTKLLRRGITFFHLFFKGFKIKADVYHCHELDALLSGLLLKLFRGKKVIYDAHEPNSEWICSNLRHRSVVIATMLFPMLLVLEIILSRLSDVIITVTEPMRRKYLKIGGHPVVVVGNYPEVPFFSDLKPIKVDGINQQDIVIARIGGMHINTGIVETIRAFHVLQKRAASVKLLLIGEIMPASFDKTLMREINGNKNIILMGPIPYEYVPSYYHSVHIAVVLGRPTLNYRLGLSVKLLENMRCGIPVITCLGENKKIIEQNDCGLICKWNDINDIADKMETLVKDKGLRERLGKNGRKAVEEHYNWEKMEERLRGVYEAVS